MKRLKGKPTPPGPKRRAQNKAILNLLDRVSNLEKSSNQQMGIIINQATVIAEAVFGIQLLLKKGIITRDELKEIRETLIHADSILSEGSSVQSEEAGSDVDSSGSGESRLSDVPSTRRDSDSKNVSTDGDVRSKFEQSNSDTPTSKSTRFLKPKTLGPSECPNKLTLIEPTEEERKRYW